MIFAFPVLIALAGVVLHFAWASRRRGSAKYLDLGQTFLLIVLVYGFVPGVGFLLAHLGIGQMVDVRLSGGFDLEIVEYVEWMFLVFITAFSASYLGLRRFDAPPGDHRKPAARDAAWLAWLAVGLVVGQPLLLRALGGDPGDDYASSYTALRSAPLIVQQVFGVAQQITFAALVAAVVFAVAANPARHLRVATFIGLFLLYASLSGGSRTMGFLAFFAYLVAASIYVDRFTVARALTAGVPVLALFMIAGLLRDKDPDAGLLSLVQSGEFTALFTNVVDLKGHFDGGAADEVRLIFYVVDLLRLIPSQLLGGEKLDPARWYVETFYTDYYDSGGGFAFGLLSECVAGSGWPDAAVRGLLLGATFAWCANRLLAPGASVTRVFVYCWLLVLAYQSFRDTTFSLVVRAIYQLVPLIGLMALVQALRRRTVSKQSPGQAPSTPR